MGELENHSAKGKKNKQKKKKNVGTPGELWGKGSTGHSIGSLKGKGVIAAGASPCLQSWSVREVKNFRDGRSGKAVAGWDIRKVRRG